MKLKDKNEMNVYSILSNESMKKIVGGTKGGTKYGSGDQDDDTIIPKDFPIPPGVDLN